MKWPRRLLGAALLLALAGVVWLYLPGRAKPARFGPEDCRRLALTDAGTGRPITGIEDIAPHGGWLFLAAQDRLAAEAAGRAGRPAPEGAIYRLPLAALAAPGPLALAPATLPGFAGPLHPHGIDAGRGRLVAINRRYGPEGGAGVDLRVYAIRAAGLEPLHQAPAPGLCAANDVLLGDRAVRFTLDRAHCPGISAWEAVWPGAGGALGRMALGGDGDSGDGSGDDGGGDEGDGDGSAESDGDGDGSGGDGSGASGGDDSGDDDGSAESNGGADGGGGGLARIAEGLVYPNGLAEFPYAGAPHLAVAETRARRVTLLPAAGPGGAADRQHIDLPGAPDNLMPAPGGRVLAALHPSLLRLALYRFGWRSRAPSRLVAIHPADGRVEMLYDDPSGRRFSAATVGHLTGAGILVAGSVRDAGLLVCGGAA
ncbi:hypothetical protein LNKW23_04840 [Paralimibaculum aggregatum]|uniref:Uncharacterized protein n=1 Tax=Paralimibaculum aggregatum TaxID=3036245 RepID=A0ABQ6LD41_9RHOB|nr:hypothetical protein [Limibaculum sp. NKW23]GMG81271.1 hypothetical protein LNKW23_04840 [Limibaculum sp. NKW23]